MTFVISIRPSVRLSFCPHVYQRGPHWTDFHKICYWGLIWKSAKKTQNWLKSVKNIGKFKWRLEYFFLTREKLNVHKRAHFEWNFIRLLEKPRRYKDNANAPWCYVIYKKVKCSRYRPGVAQRVGRGIALLFHDRGTRRGWVVSSTPRPHFTTGKDLVSILQEAGWAPLPVWRAEILVPTAIRSRTVQPVVSRYTDWATGPTCYMYIVHFLNTKRTWFGYFILCSS
jgi:hypothetical protein